MITRGTKYFALVTMPTEITPDSRPFRRSSVSLASVSERSARLTSPSSCSPAWVIDTSAAAAEQGEAERALQVTYLRRDSWSGQVQFRRGPREAAVV